MKGMNGRKIGIKNMEDFSPSRLALYITIF